MAISVQEYEALNGEKAADNLLIEINKDMKNLGCLQSVMSQSSHPHAMIAACRGLETLFDAVSDATKAETKQFLLEFVFDKSALLTDRQGGAVLRKYIRFLCTIVKMQWLDHPEFQNFHTVVQQAMEKNESYWMVGLQIFADLTEVMQPDTANLSKSRRIAVSFRDIGLKEIFGKTYEMLTAVADGTKVIAPGLLEQLLRVASKTMQFDFMGTLPDESSDEITTVMLPNNWLVMRDGKICGIFSRLYRLSCELGNQNCALYTLEFLTSLAALRRSFFPSDIERSQLINQLIVMSTEALEQQLGLQWQPCYHEMCKLLSKLNTANKLRELLEVPEFMRWIDAVYKFTTQALSCWSEMPHSKHYLMQFWSVLVQPLAHIPDDSVDGLKQALVQISLSFIDGQMRLANAFGKGEAGIEDDPLGDETTRTSTLEVLVALSKHRLLPIAERLGSQFEAAAIEISSGSANGMNPGTIAGLTWCLYAIGALIGGHAGDLASSDTADDNQHMGADGVNLSTHVIIAKLASPVLMFMEAVDKNAPGCEEAYELAVVYFIEKLRTVHFSETAPTGRHSASSYLESLSLASPSSDSESLGPTPPKVVSSLLGLTDGMTLLDIIVRKLVHNLTKPSTTVAVGKATLSTLQSLCGGVSVVNSRYSSGRFMLTNEAMVKCEAVKTLLANHRSGDLCFLNHPSMSRFRTSFYFSLGKLLFAIVKGQSDDDKTVFSNFMAPLTEVADVLRNDGVQDPNVRRTELAKLFRDLRGLVQAAATPDQYILIYNWLVDYPTHLESCRIALVHKSISAFWSDSEVCIAVLRFMAEFAANKGSGRISFPQNSPNGLILFRVVGFCLLEFGKNSLERQQYRDIYQEKYKPTAIATEMFCNAINGEYVNAGAFAFYGDDTLAKAIETGLDLTLQIPAKTMSSYAKSLRPVYVFLQLVSKLYCQHYFLLRSGPVAVLQLLEILTEGFMSFDSNTRTQACNALACFVAFCCEMTREVHHNDPKRVGLELRAQEACKSFLATHHASLRKCLSMLFQVSIFENTHSNWSLSRPMLPLILLFPDELAKIQAIWVERQPDQEKKVIVVETFRELMQGIKEGDLSDKNRDQFTSQLYSFSQSLKTKVSP